MVSWAEFHGLVTSSDKTDEFDCSCDWNFKIVQSDLKKTKEKFKNLQKFVPKDSVSWEIKKGNALFTSLNPNILKIGSEKLLSMQIMFFQLYFIWFIVYES